MIDQNKLSPKVKTGIAGLDSILGGGLPANHIYLVQGNPGSGKTTLALQFLLEGLREGETGLYITLSESKKEMLEVAASHGWSLDGIDLHEASIAEDVLMPEGQYTFFHPSEVELSETTKALLDAVEVSKPRRLVFDSLSELRLLARDPLRYRRQIIGLKHYFTGKNCTVLLIDDITSPDSELQQQSIAHGVISLEQEPLEYGAERRRVRIAKLRGANFRSGYHDLLLETGGIRVFPRLIAAEHKPSYKRELASSGVTALDNLLGGGFDRGSSNLLVGPSGAGKSVVATQFACAAAARGEHSTFFIFDEVIDTFIQRSEALQLPVRKYMQNGSMNVQQIDPAETSPGEFGHRVREAAETYKSKVVVIDSLNGYTLSMPEQRFLVAQLHELLSYLSQMGVITILISSQHGVVGSSATSDYLNISYLADSAVHMRFFETRGRVRKAISVIKKRSSRHEDAIRELILRNGGVEVGKPLEHFEGVLTGIPRYVGEPTSQKAGYA